MDRSLILALILVLCTAMAPAFCQRYYSDSKPYVPAPKRVTHLHFFLHDILSGQNPSVVMVARPNMTTALNETLFPFGSVFVTDDQLTVGPNLTSDQVIGNAQGIYVSASQEALSYVMYWEFAFTQGEFNGSSFSVFSRYPISLPVRELAVVGGTGQFRLAEGFAQVTTYYANFTSGDAISEHNVTLIHQ
ncbi:hypothetical protein REPUB_Repub04eG0043300 [Reevesia pubescens]